MTENEELKVKKESLYEKKDISKFELGSDKNKVDKKRILSDKTYAFEHMCQKDSKDLENLYNQLNYTSEMNI